MTIFSSLPKSPDVLSFLAGLEGGKSPKSVPSEGSDGFAELLDQLSAVLPADAEALGLLTGRQDAGLPGGKDLPVDLAGLPVAAEGTGREAATHCAPVPCSLARPPNFDGSPQKCLIGTGGRDDSFFASFGLCRPPKR